MGRRSTKTTKTGKFMNPTDQWRKQQRRKELKKNKKQRKVVREAVLRMKDVGQMLEEIEEIEKMQMTSLVSDPSPNEKGLEEKKAKLHASVHRVAAYYQGEDPKKAQEIRLLIMESEKKRRQMSTVYNSYRTARSEYSIDQIPLPDASEDGGGLLPSDIPMPGETSTPDLPPGLVPPGPPPGSPPADLPEYHVVETERKTVHFASAVEDSDGESADEEDGASNDESESDSETEELSAPVAPPGPPPAMLPPLHPPPPILASGFPPRVGLPPGPPPGLPPPRFGGPKPLMPPSAPHIQSGAVLSAPPSHVVGQTEDKDSPRAAVISAQPQLRNMTAEVTKFTPTSLKVRRHHPTAKPTKTKQSTPATMVPRAVGMNKAPQTQGDAYDAFMKEMQGLL